MKYILVCLLFSFSCYALCAQHNSDEKKLIVKKVFSDALTDAALKGFNFQCSIMTIPAGYSDSVAHRHDADLFVYISKGSVKIDLEGRGAETYHAGQMFHEPRNILHKRLENTDKQNDAEVLLLYIIKDGRKTYAEEKH